MLVSRKNLSFMHLISHEVATGADVAQALHQGVHCLRAARLRRVLLEPFAKSRIEGLMLTACNRPGLFDEVRIRT